MRLNSVVRIILMQTETLGHNLVAGCYMALDFLLFLLWRHAFELETHLFCSSSTQVWVGNHCREKLPFGLPSTPLSRNADQTEWREGIFWLCLANVGLERASAKSQAVSVLFNGITLVVMIQQTEFGSLWI